MPRKDAARSTRRAFLKTSGVSAALAIAACDDRAPGAEPPPSTAPAGDMARKPAAASPHRHLVRGIDPQNIADEYARRDLDALSDANLAQQVAGIISNPPVKGGSSFTLHAPLELLARAGLMPLLDVNERALARLQMVASAATFESTATLGGPPKTVAPFPDASAARAEFARAFQGRDAEALEAIMLQFASQFGTSNLVQVLTPLALPTLTGASHSHIGL